MKNQLTNIFLNHYTKKTLCYLVGIMAALTPTIAVHGQGTIVFSGQVAPYGTNYYELGMLFQVIIPTRGTGLPNYDSMGIIPPNTYNNFPTNSTPCLAFSQLLSPDDYVAFSLTNGYSFGLISVQLADPNSPSYSQVSIMFEGFKTDGSTVTNTFVTPGNGANYLLSYQFTSVFASDLTSVSILSPRWAMDNLVFGNVVVPEPATGSLLAVGLLAFAVHRIRVWRRK